MNPDTIRGIANIKRNGWYASYETLGEGGWSAVHKFAKDWKCYTLTILDYGYEATMIINARDDQTAIAAFHQKYHLEEVGYAIDEKIVTFREIESNLEPA